jgi:hypothetical protein
MDTPRLVDSRARAARIALALLLGAILLLRGAVIASAQDRGIQTTPDGKLMLVSKDQGNDRWSIAVNLSDGTAIGNVFPKSGGAPSFVWCSAANIALALNPTATVYTLDCFGASACSQLPCVASGWTSLGQVTLQGTFVFSP